MKTTHKILLISIFFAVLFATFVLRFTKNFKTKPIIGDAIIYAKVDLKYANIDENGYITDITDEKKDDTVELKYKDFKNIFAGEKIGISNGDLFSASSKITKAFNESDIHLDYIEIYDDDNLRLCKGKIMIDMGDTRNIDVKIKRAIEIYPEIKDLSGTLDLKDCRNNMTDEKYIFKKS